MTWSLANVEVRAAEYDTFKIPPRADREGLRLGDLAKLVFTDAQPLGERMWVEVTHVFRIGTERIRYQGLLRNKPVMICDLAEGTLIAFGPEHVADCEAAQ